jgi:hypothetical protein
MAWTVQLTDGTTTVDLNDGTNSFLNKGGFNAPVPKKTRSLTGPNLFRHGAGLIAETYQNRTVSVNVDLTAANAGSLGGKVQDVWDILRKASEWSKDGVGTQVQLKYQWEGGSGPVYFNLLDGTINLGAGLHSQYLSAGTRIRNAQLVMECEPFAVGTAETVENLVKNPSFEIAGSALANWTISTGTGTLSRTTAHAKYGTGALLAVRTAGAEQQRANQKFVSIGGAAGDGLSASVWVKAISVGTSSMVARIRFTQGDNGDITQKTDDSPTIIADTTNFTLIKIATTLVADAATGTIHLNLDVLGGNGAGTVVWDGVMFSRSSALPTAWVSGRDVANHFDDDGQGHINYLDVYDVPGDVPALVQVKAAEVEAHSEFWMGARHDKRLGDASIWHEGEAFTGLAVVASANVSNGSFAQRLFSHVNKAGTVSLATGTATSTLSVTHNSTGTDRLLLVGVHSVDAGTGHAAVASVAFAGTAMTKISGTESPTGTTAVSVYYLASPPAVSSAVKVVWDQAIDRSVIGAVDLLGISGTVAATAVGTSTSGLVLSLNYTGSVADYQMVFVSGSNVISYLGGTAQQEAYDLGTNVALRGAAYFKPGGTGTATAGSGTISSTMNATGNLQVGVGVSLKTLKGQLTEPQVATIDIGTPPRGDYRVLMLYEKPEPHIWQVGMGYKYGGVTVDPNLASHFTTLGTAPTAWSWVDIGALTVPPVEIPVGGAIGTYQLRLNFYHDDIATQGASIKLKVDAIQLLPVNQGMVYASKVSARDVMWADSRSELKAAYVMNTADVLQSIPANQVGSPPVVHTKGSRFYMVAGTATADVAHGWAVSVTYVPRYLHVGT